MNLKKYNIKSDKSITAWDEAIPLGSGGLGCLVYGDGPLRLTLDKGELWDLRPYPSTLKEDFTYKNMVKLVKSGTDEDWKAFQKRFDCESVPEPYPTKITAGRLELDFGGKDENIRTVLDLKTAMAAVSSEKLGFKAEVFTDAVCHIGAARFDRGFDVDIHIPAYISDSDSPDSLGYPKAVITREDGFTYYVQKTFTDFTYGIVALKVKKRSGYELYFTIASSSDGSDFVKGAKKLLKDAAKRGFDEMKSEHIAWWKKYWAKSEITLGDELIEQTYYRSTYLFGACSREGFYPMPLQGVWTADDDCLPPWKGDFHFDTNTQLSYQSYLKANRLDEGRVFVDYMWSLRDVYRDFAKRFFEVDGLIIPGCTTLGGQVMCGWAQYTLTPTMSIWAAQSFDEYYLYTGDEEFLRERAYPFFKEIGDAILGLFEEKDGKLYLPLSTSPEIHDNFRESYLEPNSNFDLALLIYLFKTLKEYSEKLGLDSTLYSETLGKLDGIATLKMIDVAYDEIEFISLDRREALNESHRHFSHLMCLYPLHLINYDTEEHKKLYKDTLYTLEMNGTGLWVGFSFGMMAQIYAMMYIGNSAHAKLSDFVHGFVADNGFHLNGDYHNYGYCIWHYRPFTLEALYCFSDALHEMLLQDHQEATELFPAIPDAWKGRKIGFKTLRSRGGVLISADRYADGKTDAEITMPSDGELKFKLHDSFTSAEVVTGDDTVSYASADNTVTVKLKKGKNKISFR